jgi:conjugal transfer pilus assembly protein TraK
MFIRYIFAATAIVASFQASALQTVDAVEGHNSFVKISAKETTRIAVEGGKIRSLIATDGELTVEKDDDRGQIFIRPTVLQKPINVRLITSSGATYNLVMQAVDIPQEDLIIREPFAARGDRYAQKESGRKSAAGTMTKTVRALVASMAMEEAPSSVEVRSENKEFALWENTKFILTAVYSERELVGEKFKLTNTGKSVIRLVEQELYRKGVVAVAIENMQLEAGQSTNIYVVRSN